MKFELSSWLQIERAEQSDSGTYHCTARNDLGSVSASAVLRVLEAGETSHLCTCQWAEFPVGFTCPSLPLSVCPSEELSSHLASSVAEMMQLMGHTDYDQDSY